MFSDLFEYLIYNNRSLIDGETSTKLQPIGRIRLDLKIRHSSPVPYRLGLQGVSMSLHVDIAGCLLSPDL